MRTCGADSNIVHFKARADIFGQYDFEADRCMQGAPSGSIIGHTGPTVSPDQMFIAVVSVNIGPIQLANHFQAREPDMFFHIVNRLNSQKIMPVGLFKMDGVPRQRFRRVIAPGGRIHLDAVMGIKFQILPTDSCNRTQVEPPRQFQPVANFQINIYSRHIAWLQSTLRF